MKSYARFIPILAALAMVYLTCPEDAHAYLDPGTGSFILQLIIATLVGVMFGVKAYWYKTKTFMKDVFSKARTRISLKR